MGNPQSKEDAKNIRQTLDDLFTHHYDDPSILNLSRQELMNLNYESFHHFHKSTSWGQIKSFIVSTNKISSIEDKDLQQILSLMPNLVSLDMHGNVLTYFNMTLLIQLQQLLALDLSYNHLEKIAFHPEQDPKTLEKLTSLNLSYNKLKTIPAISLPHLESLILAHNEIEEVPKLGILCPKLKNLVLYKNQLKALDKSIGLLIHLESFNASANLLEYIPDGLELFKDMAQLKCLNLSQNNLVTLAPLEHEQIRKAKKSALRTSLERLMSKKDTSNQDSNNNTNLTPSSSPPKQIAFQSSTSTDNDWHLISLTELDISGNQLDHLPSKLSCLSALQWLNANDNNLQEFLAAESLSNLTSLQRISMRNNNIPSIPSELSQCTKLIYLELRGNPIVEIPDEVRQMTQLQMLSSVPEEILPGLYLGPMECALNTKFIDKHNITHILNVTAEVNYRMLDGINYMRLNVHDTNVAKIRDNFSDAFQFIDQGLSQGKGVLVHCAQGRSRSATGMES